MVRHRRRATHHRGGVGYTTVANLAYTGDSGKPPMHNPHLAYTGKGGTRRHRRTRRRRRSHR
jgi:hypothetical protein